MNEFNVIVGERGTDCIAKGNCDGSISLIIPIEILVKLNKNPINVLRAGWLTMRDTKFEPLPDVDIFNFMKFVYFARQEVEEDRKKTEENIIVGEIERSLQHILERSTLEVKKEILEKLKKEGDGYLPGSDWVTFEESKIT